MGKVETQRPGFSSGICLGSADKQPCPRPVGLCLHAMVLGWDPAPPEAMEDGTQPDFSGSGSPCMRAPEDMTRVCFPKGPHPLPSSCPVWAL